MRVGLSDRRAAAMQLTVKALQGRECSLQVASPGPAATGLRKTPSPSRAQGWVEGGDRAGGPPALGRPGELPSAGQKAQPLLPPSAWPGVRG